MLKLVPNTPKILKNDEKNKKKQAGAELCQSQVKVETIVEVAVKARR